MSLVFLLPLFLLAAKGDEEKKQDWTVTARSQLEKHVVAVLQECSQSHASAIKKLESQKQQCKGRSDKLRVLADEASKTIKRLQTEMNEGAGNTASLKKAAAKAERDVVLWNRRLRAVTQAHELNQTRHEVDEGHEDAQYTAMLKNLTLSIEKAKRAHDDKAANLVNMLRERADKWDAMQDAMTARDDGFQKLHKYTIACEKALVRLTSRESSLAGDVEAMERIDHLLKKSSNSSAMIDIRKLVADAQKRSQNTLWTNLASMVETSITLV